MIDTLMVLWTSGTWRHILRAICTILILFTCICLLMYLMSIGGSKWSGLAVTVAQPAATATRSKPQPAPTAVPTTAPYIVPIILQNPTPADVVPPPTHISQSSHSSRSSRRHINRRRTIRRVRPPVYSTLPPTFNLGPSNSGNTWFDLP